MKTTLRDGSGRGGIGFALIALLCSGCPDGVGATDGGESPTDALPDVAMDDLADAAAEPDDGMDDGGRDAVDDPRDAADRMDAPRDDSGMDAVVPGCVPGMSVACACEDGRMGAQVCRADGTFAACRCATADAATDARPDVVLPPLGPRLITPQSVSRVTSRRPTMRWVLPAGVTRARVELCGDRACTRMLQQQEVTDTSWRPATMLAPGVVFWRVRGLAGDGSVAWTSATWEYLVGRRDASVDTSFGTLKDFNNDGYDDAAIRGDPNERNETSVSVFHGRSERGSQTATYQILVPVDYRLAAGDFNGDGIADLMVPSGRNGVGERVPAGTIRVYYGRVGRLSAMPDAEIRIRPVLGERDIWDFEAAVGDYDGDGFSDIAVIDSGMIDSSSRMVPYTLRFFRGGPAGVPSTASLSSAADGGFVFNTEAFLNTFLAIGDVDMDGYTDLLSTYSDQYGIDPALRAVGRAWMIQGRPSFPSAAWTPIDPPTRDARFGTNAAAIGDVNGDQLADFAISSDHVVSVYLGASGVVPTRPLRTITSPSGQCYFAEASFGGALGNAGDFNGDGRADLSVGAYCLPYTGGFLLGVGSVFLYDGASDGVAVAPRILTGLYQNSQFGTNLGGFGDFNGDGFDDLSVLEQGRMRVGETLLLPPLWVYLGSSAGIGPSSMRWSLLPRAGIFESPVATYVRVINSMRGV